MIKLTEQERMLRTFKRQEIDRIPLYDSAWAGTKKRWYREGMPAGVAFKLKALYGDKLAFHGGINAQLWDDVDLVKAEMERIIPRLKEGGGYVFASDHSIPNSVSFDNMKQIAALAHKLGKY